MKTIQIEDDTHAALLALATSFDDTANDVIVRLLQTSAKPQEPAPAPRRKGPPHRAKDFELPLLRVLADAEGGTLTTNDAQEAVKALVGDRLTDKDFEPLGRGEERWRNQVRFARLSLYRQQCIDDSAGWGRWRITDKGRRRLARGA